MLKFANYVKVQSAQEAYDLLQKNRNNKIVGGGIWLRLGSRRIAAAIDLSACGLDAIEENESEFRIGAMVTLHELEEHSSFNEATNSVFKYAVRDIVGTQLRNSATVGGSVYGRFGFSDVLCALLPLDSYVELTGAGRVSLADFRNMGYVRDVIERIVVVKHDYTARYLCVRKEATDFPSLNLTCALWSKTWHIAIGARPLPATLLVGEECGLTREFPSQAMLVSMVEKVRALEYGTNLWGTAEYRRHVAGALALRAVCGAAQILPNSSTFRELNGIATPKFALENPIKRRMDGFVSPEVQ